MAAHTLLVPTTAHAATPPAAYDMPFDLAPPAPDWFPVEREAVPIALTAVRSAGALAVKPAPAVVKPSAVKVPAPRKAAPVKSAPRTEAVQVPASGRAQVVIRFALSQLGDRYVYGASGPNQWDCSGLVSGAYRQVGISLPHQSEAIRARGRRVPAGQWLPGDVIHQPGHVSIYLGSGRMIEAANASVPVRIAPIRGGTAYRFL